MRSLLFAFALGLGLLAPALARDDVRVAHVDTKIIFDKYEAVQSAQREYEAQLAVWEQQANVLQKEIEQMRDQLQKKSLLLSDEKKRELEGQLSSKEAELNRFIADVYGPNGKMVQENQRVSAPALAKIKSAISEIALQEGYDMVLDRATGAVVFWKEEHDISNQVIQYLNGKKTP